jgi:hypothetical protein
LTPSIIDSLDRYNPPPNEVLKLLPVGLGGTNQHGDHDVTLEAAFISDCKL